MNDFDPIERLVEFGLGIAVAQQMVKSMNYSMQNMYIPGQNISPKTRVSKEWYIAVDSHPVGPLKEEEIKQKMLDKVVNKDTLVWCAGMPSWEHAEKMPEILKLYLELPPSL